MRKQKTTHTISRGFLARLITTNGFDAAGAIKTLEKIVIRANTLNKQGWITSALKLWDWLLKPASQAGAPPFTMFAAGNSKLPFLSWSTLPGVNCPGAGACWKLKSGILSGWCYSVKAWRYPAAFMRQFQNTLLERGPVFRQLIHNEIECILAKTAGPVTLRLYVDGDFPNLETLRFWMDTLKKFPRLKAYGYSKSLHLFKQLDESGYNWPVNYALNGSSGGIYENTATGAYVRNMSIYRGAFVAVPVSKETGKAWKAQSMNRANTAEIRAKFPGKKVFICPGKCGECTLFKAAPHACGNMEKFQGMTIAIPLH
tara:strand:+ start:3113 stop:4054 length:942 start_codon:yes stop_codon:yes gene_type:complete